MSSWFTISIIDINVPLKEGIDDQTYVPLFSHIVRRAMAQHQSKAVIFVCGADALSNDPLGHFNLSIQAYEQCAYQILRVAREANVPLLVLGGGGYNQINTAKCWASVTGVLALNYSQVQKAGNKMYVLPNDIPEHAFFEQYAPSFERKIPRCLGMKNQNTMEDLQKLQDQVLTSLKNIKVDES